MLPCTRHGPARVPRLGSDPAGRCSLISAMHGLGLHCYDGVNMCYTGMNRGHHGCNARAIFSLGHVPSLRSPFPGLPDWHCVPYTMAPKRLNREPLGTSGRGIYGRPRPRRRTGYPGGFMSRTRAARTPPGDPSWPPLLLSLCWSFWALALTWQQPS